jgi:hypothetical protein
VAHRTVGAVTGGGLAIGFAAALYVAAVRVPPPPTSITPDSGTQAVRILHRHQTVVECRHVALQPSCTAQLIEGDTATTIRFVRAGVVPAALHAAVSTVQFALPHQPGSQEQVATLPLGQWLVDWRGASRLEQLDVREGSPPAVMLSSVSGACVQKGDRCELVAGVRERDIRVNETK